MWPLVGLPLETPKDPVEVFCCQGWV